MQKTKQKSKQEKQTTCGLSKEFIECDLSNILFSIDQKWCIF